MGLGERVVAWPDWRRHKLTPKLAGLYGSRARKMLINGGRGGGKDHLTFLRGLRLAFELYAQRVDDPDWLRLGLKVHVGVAAPKAENFDDLWRRFRDLLPEIPGNSSSGQANIHTRTKDNHFEAMLFGPNELQFSFGSAFQGDNIRGGGFDILIITEAAFLRERVLAGSYLPLVIRPGFDDFYVMLNSSPRGPGHWWDAACKGSRDGSDPYWADWEYWGLNYYDNPLTTESLWREYQLEKARNLYRYRQERLGWLDVDVPDDAMLKDGQYRAFEPGLIDGCLVTERCEHHGPYYVGVDLAGTGPDPLTVCVVDGRTGIVVHVESHARTTPEEIIELFRSVAGRWAPVGIWYDANGPLGKRVEGKLPAISRPILTPRAARDSAKVDQAKHLEAHLIAGSVRVPHPQLWRFDDARQQRAMALLVRELRGYCRYELRQDKLNGGRRTVEVFTTYDKAPDGSDDMLDALKYALHGRRVPSVVGAARRGLSEDEVWGN